MIWFSVYLVLSVGWLWVASFVASRHIDDGRLENEALQFGWRTFRIGMFVTAVIEFGLWCFLQEGMR